MDGRERDWWRLVRDVGSGGVLAGLWILVEPVRLLFDSAAWSWAPEGWVVACMGACMYFVGRAGMSTEKMLADRQAKLEGKLDAILEKLNEQKAES